MYVGRSDNLLDRIRTHGNGGSRKSQAAFASNIAKGEIMEDFMADYEKKYPDACKSDKEWRNALNWELAKNSEFRRPFETEFKKAKKRVRKMGFRVVKIEDSSTKPFLKFTPIRS